MVHSGACIREGCEIGDYGIIQNGAVVGSEGFGYVPDLELGLRHVPQTGNVKLEARVDIGANTCIDRGTAGDTHIHLGSKLDNLVQVGHNVSIGSHSILCGQVGIAGSVNIGEQVVLGGNSGVADHVDIVSGVRVAAKSGVIADIDEKGDYIGFPAQKASTWRRQLVNLKNLPKILKELKGSKKK